ncbi:fibronectin type III domain-containing protein [Myxococcus stipitatus]|uniref:fibronectin type III domain-containing protein n=1 Tax=Myxococcus stipitatus TaxID=83455 RepID=UPI0030CB10E8
MQRLRKSFVLGAACVSWLVGCGAGPGDSNEFQDGVKPVVTDTGTPGDGTWMGEPVTEGCAPDAGSPPDGGPAPSDVVFVKRLSRFHTSVGVAERAEDLSANPPEILVHDGANFLVIQGSAAPGGWRFSGVPEGTYYLHTGASYVVTDAREVDIGNNRVGRPDVVSVAMGPSMPLQLNLLNLTPWQPGSRLHLNSTQLEFMGETYLFNGLPAGSTSINTSDAEFYSSLGMTLPVLEAEKGDRFHVNQVSPFPAGRTPDGRSLTYYAVERSLEVAPFDFVPDGVTPLPVTGKLQPAKMREFPMEWRLPAYAHFTSEVHPSAQPTTASFNVAPTPYGVDETWIGYAGELLTLRIPQGAIFDFTSRLKFGNPYPSSWGVLSYLSFSYRVTETVPDGSGRTVSLSGTNGGYDMLDNLISGPVVPRVSPPRAVTIDGVKASTPREVGTASPVVAWEPPVLGTPNSYRVGLFRYDTQLGMTVPSGYLYAPGSVTQVRLPPDMLQPDSIYYLRVTAVDAPRYDVKHTPFKAADRMPHYNADAISSLFTTP